LTHRRERDIDFVMRINKYLSSFGVTSRRQADRLIKDGRVRINGRVATVGDQIGDEDVVVVDKEPIAANIDRIYIAYHKPIGVETTTSRLVKHNLVDELGFDFHFFPIGRLDKDSSGLLLLTNDGDIVNQILRPEFHHEKEYLVHVDRPFDHAFLKKMREGIIVQDKRTQGAYVERHNKRAFNVVLTEGRNRQIRRMCEALGYTVTALKRVRVMNVHLGRLKPGGWRHLKPREKKSLLAACSR